MTELEPVLRVENLVKHFHGKHGGPFSRKRAVVQAVDDVSFDLHPGETLGIVGESGCGKSTLARTLVRLTEPTAGHAWFEGRDIFALDREQLRAVRNDIQMIFQDPYSSVNPRLTIEAIVAEAWDAHPDAVPKDARRQKVIELLDRVGLDADALLRRPREFSGGQLQRIGIARALAVDPRLLICDEPVSALDVSIQAQVLNLLKELQRERNVAYVFISHDLAVVQQVADRIAVMYLGKIVEIGPAEEICSNPSHPYTQALLTAVPVAARVADAAPDRRIRLRGEAPDPSDPPSGCRFRTRCWKATDLCAREVPALIERVQPGVASACHFAAPMALISEGELAVATAAAPEEANAGR
jgi:oligopeptide transport system ATP-binding protein